MPPRLPLVSRCRNKPAQLCTRYNSPALLLFHFRQCVRHQTSTTRIVIRPQFPQSIQIAIDKLQHVLQNIDARGHSSSSRIQLAIRGLQQPNAPVRLAVTGPNAHTLLVSLLKPEPDEPWVSEISQWIAGHEANPATGLILRYAPRTERRHVNQSSPSGLAVISAPIEVLRTHALEILIAPGILQLNTTPTFYIPENGRLIEFPVHKAIEYVGPDRSGLSRLVSSPLPKTDEDSTVRVISLPKGLSGDIAPSIMVVESLDGTDIDRVKSWILAGTTGSFIKPAVARLVRDILSNATIQLQQPQASLECISVNPLPDTITEWSIEAHKSIKYELEDLGFRSSQWAGIEWWKLLWRADDVGHIARHIVATYFLQKTEKDAAFLAGQIVGAGMGREGSKIPPHISQHRREIVKDLIDSLQIAAQRCLLRSLEVSIGSGALAGLLLFSGAGTAVASGLASAGIFYGAWSLRRRWGREKLAFEEDIRERARQAVLETERWAWERIKARDTGQKADHHERRAGEHLLVDIEEARTALESLPVRWATGVEY